MASGMQVWDANSALILDTSTFTGKFLGKLEVAPTGNSTISFSNTFSVTKNSLEKIWAVAYPTLGAFNSIYVTNINNAASTFTVQNTLLNLGANNVIFYGVY